MICKEKLYKNIENLCAKKGITMYGLEKQLGFSRHAIDKCNIISISWEKVAIIAEFFGVSVDYLIGNTNNPYSHKQSLSPSSKILLESSENLQIPEETAHVIVKIMKALIEE